MNRFPNLDFVEAAIVYNMHSFMDGQVLCLLLRRLLWKADTFSWDISTWKKKHVRFLTQTEDYSRAILEELTSMDLSILLDEVKVDYYNKCQISKP